MRKPKKEPLITPRLVRPLDAQYFLGGAIVLAHCESEGWIKPVVRRHGITLYSVTDLHICADRIERGEYPKR